MRGFFSQTLVLFLLGISAAHADDASAVTEAQSVDLDLPAFQTVRPKWGFHASAAVPFVLNLEADFQPQGIQDYGIFGVGPALHFYSNQQSEESWWSWGVQARYQFRYWRKQWLVPTVAYHFEHLPQASKSQAFRAVPSAGLWLLLNVLNTDTAGVFYMNYGLARSYFVTEVRSLPTQGLEYLAGFRLEY